MPSIEWMLLYILLGFFVGFMAGLLGVGGGGILVPLLVSIFSYQSVSADNVVHLALGTMDVCSKVFAEKHITSPMYTDSLKTICEYSKLSVTVIGSILTISEAI